MNNEIFMRRAIELSRFAIENNFGGPFGAVIVLNNEIVGEGYNTVIFDNDPTAHAEVNAIRNASKKLKSFHLNDCILYTSCEPCPMCLGAIYWAQINKIYYANNRSDAASINFNDDYIYNELSLNLNERSIPTKQIIASEAFEVFKEWNQKQDKTPY